MEQNEEEDPVVILDLPEEQQQNASPSHKKDGERTPNRGPCLCGYKHWCEGKEYDFVFQWPGINAVGGFNLTDNYFKIAEDYVTRHHKSQRWDHRQVVHQIAEAIMKQTEGLRGPSEVVQPKQEKSTFDPYKADMHVPVKGTTRYNEVTGKFEKTTYAHTDFFTPEQEAEIKRKQAVLDENQKKLEREKKEEQEKKAGILEVIRRDRQEKDKEEEEKLLIKQSVTKSPGSSSNTNKIAKVEGGSIVWVDAPVLKTPPRAPSGNGATFRSITDLHHDHHHHHDHDHHHDHHDHDHHDHPHHPSFHHDFRDPRFDSDDEDDFIEKYSHLPKRLWTEENFLRLFSEGEDITKKVMQSAGFNENEIEKAILNAHLRMLRKKLKQDGRRLGGSGENFLHTTHENFQTVGGHPNTINTSFQNIEKKPQDNIPTPTGPIPEFTVDNDAPKTVLKIRLIDGSTKELTVNLTHTVSDIMAHIRLLTGVSEFKLVNNSAFPRKPLTELSQTVKDANLLNTTLIQTR